MLNISDYIVETIVFAHVLPISREYAAVVFIGRKHKAACNRLVLALLKAEDNTFSVLDEVSLPSWTLIRANVDDIVLAAESVNLHFMFIDERTIKISYTDRDFFGEEPNASEEFTIGIQDF